MQVQIPAGDIAGNEKSLSLAAPVFEILVQAKALSPSRVCTRPQVPKSIGGRNRVPLRARIIGICGGPRSWGIEPDKRFLVRLGDGIPDEDRVSIMRGQLAERNVLGNY